MAKKILLSDVIIEDPIFKLFHQVYSKTRTMRKLHESVTL